MFVNISVIRGLNLIVAESVYGKLDKTNWKREMFCVLYPFDYKIPSGYIGSKSKTKQDFRWRGKRVKWLGLLQPCGFTFIKKKWSVIITNVNNIWSQ